MVQSLMNDAEEREYAMSKTNIPNYDTIKIKLDRTEALVRQLGAIDRARGKESIDREINATLALLGEITKAGRVYLFDKTDDMPERYSNTYEWCAPGVVPQLEQLQSLSVEDMSHWLDIFKKGETLVIEDIDSVASTMPQEYEILKVQDIHSVIETPIFYRDHLSGFIGLDNPAPNQSELFLQMLSLVGGHLGSSRESTRMVSLLQQKQEALQKTIRDMENEREMLMVLCADSISVFRVDLRTNRAETVKLDANANVSAFIDSEKRASFCYTEELEKYYRHFVIKETAPDLLEIFSPENLMRELETKKLLSRRYQCVPNLLGQVYFEARAMRISNSEDTFRVLIDFRNIDGIVREERQHQRELETALDEMRMNNEVISALGKIYFLIYRINIPLDHFEEISQGSGIHRLTGRSGRASKQFFDLCKQCVEAEYFDRVLEFFDLTTLNERLGSEDSVAAEYLASDGNWHLARFIVQQRNEKCEAVQALCVIRLISEEKRRERYWITAAEEANKANDAKSEFLSRMSHDIRTPMNVIMGFVRIAQQNLENSDKVRDCLDKISMSGKNLQQLVDDVLDISRIESGEFKLISQSVDIPALIEYYHQTMIGFDAGKGVLIHCSTHDISCRFLMVDPLRLGQIYTNLLSNAIKYTPSGGNVLFEVYEEQISSEKVQLVSVIKDTGIGMTPDFMEKMYSEFSRAVDTRVNKVRGSGLGLAIVKRLVDLMGGEIRAESEVGKGTTFTVTLPLLIGEEKEAEDQKPTAQISSNHIHTLLVAEDNELNYEIMEEQLKEYQITCFHAENGAECVQMFSDSPFRYDAILMDMQMPLMNGMEASKRIREMDIPEAKVIPIIAVTANAYHEDIKMCLQSGMNAHISKPVDAENVIRTVERFLPENKKE